MFRTTLLALAVVTAVAVTQSNPANPTPTPSEPTYRKFRIGHTVCGELGRGPSRWHVRGCKPLEDLVAGTLPTPTPARTPTPAPTGTPWQPTCPSRCPAGTTCDALLCSAFGDCSCR